MASQSSHDIIKRILLEQDIEYESNNKLIAKLNNFMASQTTQLLKDAKARSEHLKKPKITLQDIRQVILDRRSKYKDQKIPQNLVDQKNKQTEPLIPIKKGNEIFGGIRLPLNKANWNLSTNQFLYKEYPHKKNRQFNMNKNGKMESNNQLLDNNFQQNQNNPFYSNNNNMQDDNDDGFFDDDNSNQQQQQHFQQPIQRHKPSKGMFDDDDEDEDYENDEENDGDIFQQQQQEQQQSIPQQQSNNEQQLQQTEQVNQKRKFQFNINGLDVVQKKQKQDFM